MACLMMKISVQHLLDLKTTRGCPDTDKDGVYDNGRRFVETTPGPKENKGCPVIKEEVKKKIALAAKGIFFETASDKN